MWFFIVVMILGAASLAAIQCWHYISLWDFRYFMYLRSCGVEKSDAIRMRDEYATWVKLVTLGEEEAEADYQSIT